MAARLIHTRESERTFPAVLAGCGKVVDVKYTSRTPADVTCPRCIGLRRAAASIEAGIRGFRAALGCPACGERNIGPNHEQVCLGPEQG